VAVFHGFILRNSFNDGVGNRHLNREPLFERGKLQSRFLVILGDTHQHADPALPLGLLRLDEPVSEKSSRGKQKLSSSELPHAYLPDEPDESVCPERPLRVETGHSADDR